MLTFRMSQWHSDSTGTLFFPVCVAWHQLPVGLSLTCFDMPQKACVCPGCGSVPHPCWHFLLLGKKKKEKTMCLARPGQRQIYLSEGVVVKGTYRGSGGQVGSETCKWKEQRVSSIQRLHRGHGLYLDVREQCACELVCTSPLPRDKPMQKDSLDSTTAVFLGGSHPHQQAQASWLLLRAFLGQVSICHSPECGCLVCVRECRSGQFIWK